MNKFIRLIKFNFIYFINLPWNLISSVFRRKIYYDIRCEAPSIALYLEHLYVLKRAN